MSVNVGGELPTSCTLVAKGTIFRMFDGKCQNKLLRFPDAPAHTDAFKNFSARSDRKDSMIEYENKHQIRICDPDNVIKPYAKKGFMLRMKTKKFPLCPFDNPPFKVLVQAQYSEAINPTFPVLSPWFSQTVDWPEDQTSVNLTVVTESIGDPFEHGSTGSASANITVYLEYDEPGNSCVDPSVHTYAKLNNMGYAIDWNAGPPIEQWKQISSSCYYFEHGWTPMDNYWTTAFYYAGPLGVVSNLFVRVWGVWE